ncbi:MAG: serine/threonine-protein phosphatase [Planctomycetota bacterium]|nr:MAG: serine/threonine-protein phosphatase [Planctomycetota bacterium]
MNSRRSGATFLISASTMGNPMTDPTGEPVEISGEQGVFRAEYERELGQWLRRRLGMLCIAYALFQVVSTTVLILGSVWSASANESAISIAPPTPIEMRAERAEQRADAGLPPRPGDAAAIAAADRIEQRQAQRDARDSRDEPVVSTLDALGTIAQRVVEKVVEPKTSAPRAEVSDTVTDGGDTQLAQDTNESGAETPPNIGTQLTREISRAPLQSIETLAETATHVAWRRWVLASLPFFAVVAYFGIYVRARLYTRSEFVRAATRMILLIGFVSFALDTTKMLLITDTAATPLLTIFFWHLTASLFLPWTWRESLKPILPLLACWLLLRLGLAVSNHEWISLLFTVIAVPFLFAPALFLCYARLRWHRNRFKSGFVGRRFLAMRREFMQARAVHESLFPKPLDAGWMRFDFGYRPAADIGGDFIHAWMDDQERFHLMLLDVTGHGLASAMTVARIHGEIERLRDEHPEEGPARLLARLNRYFHRLLARHQLYATGLILTLDSRSGELRYASAGHPPIFLRSRGKLRELESTTFLLGAVDSETFGQEEASLLLNEGDTMVLLTDGAYDAKSPRGERFGLDRLRELMRRPTGPTSWPTYLMRLIETFEAGMTEDDLLIAEIVFLSRRSVFSGITGDAPPSNSLIYAQSAL